MAMARCVLPVPDAVEVEVVDVLGQRELGDRHLIFDGARLFFRDLGVEKIADDLRRLMLPLDAGRAIDRVMSVWLKLIEHCDLPQTRLSSHKQEKPSAIAVLGLFLGAAEIRMRAERRLCKLIRTQKETSGWLTAARMADAHG